MKRLPERFFPITLFIVFSVFFAAGPAQAASAVEINAKVNATLKEFYRNVGAGRALAKRASGILVFPSVLKAGFWIGAQYGEGALRVGGRTAGYYNIAGASFGFQFGAQSKSVIMLFMTQGALSGFRNSQGWKAGVDGAVAIATLGAGGSLDTDTLRKPIIGFVFGNKGLMVDVSLAGSKISRIRK